MNKNIIFFTNQLCGRGTTKILFDYAKYNQLILNNKSKIMTLKNPKGHFHNNEVIKDIQKSIDVIFIDDYSQINSYNKNVDVFYASKYGNIDGIMMKDTKNIIHSIFCASDPHGDEYFYLSEFCARKCNWNNWLEPIVDISNIYHTDTWKKKLNIKKSDIVFGRTGGYDSFNIKFVHKTIEKTVNKHKHIKFIFANTEPFYEHENIIYFPYLKNESLISFINTCDAMIHARDIGETFGMSIAEFSSCNKPIITGKHGDLAHIDYLDEYYEYTNSDDLYHIFTNFEKNNREYNFYKRFSPETMIRKFETFL